MQSSSGLIEDRVIMSKHKEANFFSVAPFVLGRTLSQIPQVAIDTLMFGIILYYELGLADRQEFSNLYTFLGLLFIFSLLMSQQLSVFASFAGTSTLQALSACVIMLMMLFGGFIIAPDTIPYYYSWVYWWNPFAWVYRALLVLEFRSKRWSNDNPDLILRQLGFLTPDGDAFGSEWVRYSFYYMIPYFVICFLLTALGLTKSAEESFGSPEPKITKHAPSVHHERVYIPFKPVTLSFHDICYEVPASTKNETLLLLNQVNGVFRPGRMCCMMGSSGAGKVSMNVGCRRVIELAMQHFWSSHPQFVFLIPRRLHSW